MEMRNVLLETKGKAILNYKWQRTWLNCVLVFCGRQNLQSGYLAGEISKQGVEGIAWFLLTTYNKMQKERHELKKELLSKKKPEYKDLENSQPTHMAKNEETWSGENTNGVAG